MSLKTLIKPRVRLNFEFGSFFIYATILSFVVDFRDCDFNSQRYGIFYALYLTKAIVFDMNAIILMFGFGMVVHFIISLIEEKVFLRKSECGECVKLIKDNA